MLDAFEKMSVGQQQQFRDTANKLLATTFLSRDKKDNKEAYYFLMSYKDLFDEFFQILGYEIELDMQLGAVKLNGASAMNTLKLKRDETLVLLIECFNSDKPGYCSPHHRLLHVLRNDTFDQTGRIFLAIDWGD